MMRQMQVVSTLAYTNPKSYECFTVSDESSNDLVLSFSLSGGIFWRRGRQIIRYENLKDYLTFRVSYLF